MTIRFIASPPFND